MALLAAARAPELIGSLIVVEPPAMDIARGTPDVDRFIAEGQEWWAHGPHDDPEAFLRGFLRFVGSDYEPALPVAARARAGGTRPHRGAPPVGGPDPARDARSGAVPEARSVGWPLAAFDAVCDVLAKDMGAERLVLAGYGHSAQRHPAFNEHLAAFVENAAALRASPAV